MPVMDIVKKRIAREHRLHMKICRKCRNKNLRWKRRELRRGGA